MAWDTPLSLRLNCCETELQNPAKWRMPAEWEPHAACWMAWPCRAETFSANGLTAARQAYARVANSISAFEPVTMLCASAEQAEARQMLSGAVTLLDLPTNDSWTRDTAPSFVVSGDGRQLGGVDWRFNAWGGNYPDCAADAALAQTLLHTLGAVHLPSALTFEGGALSVDGEGTLLTTAPVALNANRNPGWQAAQVEAAFAPLGVSRTVWLPGTYEQDETDGHVDEVACFVRPGLVLHLQCTDSSDPNSRAFAKNIALLNETVDAQGRHLQVATIPQPRLRLEQDGVRLTLSYLNFLIANGLVLAPSFGVPEDDAARGILAELFPDRRVVQIPVLDIVRGGGGIHCITQQQPALFP
jgi:agmatine deiminase